MKGVAGAIPGLALLAVAAAPEAGPAPAAALAPVADPAPRDEFEALVREIGVLKEDLADLSRREKGLLDEIDRLQVEAALRAREIRRLEVRRSDASHELERTREQLALQRGLVALQESALASHLRESYKLGRLQEARLLLALADPSDVLPAMTYLEAMSRRRASILEGTRRGREQLAGLERSLEQQEPELRNLEERRRQEAEALEQVRTRSAALLADTERQRGAHEAAIAELTRAAEDLEAAIVAGAAEAGPLGVPRVDAARLRGALEWPATGHVERPFGEVRHPRFGTVTPHPGLDIRTEPGAPIRAVLGGRVVFARRFSGYGNTVLLDHGGAYLSVYARAAILNVAEGDRVLAGQVVGQCAERGAGGGPPLVYFEFREQGRAVDPAVWLKRRPAGFRRESDR